MLFPTSRARARGRARARDRFSGRIAVTTAILATLGALMSFAGGDTQPRRRYSRTTRRSRRPRANDQWTYYQAKGNKRNLAEVAATLVTQPDRSSSTRARPSATRRSRPRSSRPPRNWRPNRRNGTSAARSRCTCITPLGAGRHRDADRDRAVGHRAADPPQLAGVRRVRGGRDRRRLRGAGARGDLSPHP